MEQIRVSLQVEYFQIFFSQLVIVTTIRLCMILLLTPKNMPSDRTALSLFDHSVVGSCLKDKVNSAQVETKGTSLADKRASFRQLFKREWEILWVNFNMKWRSPITERSDPIFYIYCLTHAAWSLKWMTHIAWLASGWPQWASPDRLIYDLDLIKRYILVSNAPPREKIRRRKS